jgi:hypothetical protein
MEVEVVAETGSKNLTTRLPTQKKKKKIGKKKENNTPSHNTLKIESDDDYNHLSSPHLTTSRVVENEKST